IARGVWVVLDHLLGASLVAQIFSVGIASAVACAIYAKLMLTMRVPEARQIQGLIMARLRSS
ncbi:MAG: hypothetical protein JO325_17810, partial [Solirubrobacterales bacterium]|nr:hypothetical protein [Solirubrobacterales bacterium]